MGFSKRIIILVSTAIVALESTDPVLQAALTLLRKR
jgi:hypothetical protein